MYAYRLLAATALASASFVAPAVARAQTAPAPQTPPASADGIAEDRSQTATGGGDAVILVTGSRIARPNLESTVPITTVTGEEIFETGNISVGDLLNDLPSVRNTFSQSNSSRFLGTAGLNLLDLRGLGTQRTLTLVNNRRHVGGDILSNAVSVDVNTIPADLIERVDVITGGSSAVYGSDAIAGVVNFVLKRDFDGIQVRGQNGISTYGDANAAFLSVTAGTNFADGRGNIAINGEYAHQEPFFASQRPNLRRNGNFVVVDTDPASATSDDVIDRIFVRDIRSTTISNGGLLNIRPGAGLAPCGTDASGSPFACTLLFQPDGSLVPQTGERIGIAPNGSFSGGNGFTGREGQSLGIFPKLDRYSVNLLGHFEVSEALVPFIEAKYVRTDSRRFGSPAFFQGGTIDGEREQPRFDNPFLTDQARATIQSVRAAAGLDPATGETRLALRRNLLDFGGRQEEARRETYRIVGGVQGTFNDDWKYEVSLNYGEFRERTQVQNNLNLQRFVLAMDSARDPATGNIVCRSQIDPAAATIFPFSGNDAYAQGRLAEDVASCVPLNPFGEGNISPAARQYLRADTTSVGKITQFVASAFVSGDTSAWFELPGGPIGFAVGGEYRRETNFFQTGEIIANNLTFYNALPLFDPPAFEVKEAYGEIRVPLLKDTFIDELSLNAAGRVSDYKGRTGTVYSYNLGVDFAPVQDVRFRAGYARAVRAPNLVDLYSDQSQNFAPSFVDPCSARNIGTGSANRGANCAAAGIPATFDYVYDSSLEILSGGNPDLREETSDSYFAGVVVQPSFVPGLSIAVDYFDITVNDVITAPTAQQIVNACYDAADLDNQFCGLFQRNAGSAAQDPYRIVEGSLQSTLLNYAKLTARGIDVDGAYRRNLDGIGLLNLRMTYTHMLERNEYLDPSDPERANRILGELGDPQDAFNFNASIKVGKVTIGSQLRYIGKMVLNTYEDYFSVQGRPPENPDYGPRIYYPSVWYQDFRIAMDVGRRFNAYLGIDNAFNRQPPFSLTGTGEGSGIYDVRGRFIYAGFRANF